MDDIEIATVRAEADREALVALHHAHRKAPAVMPRHGDDGRRICVHCEEPIALQRLTAVPDAVVCTTCAAAHEAMARRFPRRSS